MTTTNADRHVRPFAAWLQDQRAGEAHNEASDALNELVEAVQATGKQGTLTITVKVKPAGKGDHGTVLVADTVTVKLPQAERGESIFFADDDHNLTRHNPNQPALPLQEVPRPDMVTGGAADAKAATK